MMSVELIIDAVVVILMIAILVIDRAKGTIEVGPFWPSFMNLRINVSIF